MSSISDKIYTILSSYGSNLESFLGVLPFIFFISLIVGSIYYGKYRIKQLEQKVTSVGFHLHRINYKEIRNISLAGTGLSVHSNFYIEGKIGHNEFNIYQAARMFGGKNKKIYALAKLEPNWKLPDFKLSRENFITKIADALGQKDINPEHSPNFSKQFNLTGTDEQMIRKVFDTHLTQFFENNPYRFDVVSSAGKVYIIVPHSLSHTNVLTFIEQCGKIYSELEKAAN